LLLNAAKGIVKRDPFNPDATKKKVFYQEENSFSIIPLIVRKSSQAIFFADGFLNR